MRVPKIFYPHNPRSRYLYLLLWLIGYLLTSAVAEETGGKLWLMDILFVGVLMATLRAVSRTPREFMIAVLMGGLTMAAALAAAAYPEPHFLTARAILGASFTGFLSVVILREVLQGGSVDVDKIFGAVCAYLLVGVCGDVPLSVES
jgi:hypothetical protein